MTADEFHKKLLTLVKQASRSDLCAACVVLELVSGAQAIAIREGLDSLDLAFHGVPDRLFEPAAEPRHHHLH